MSLCFWYLDICMVVLCDFSPYPWTSTRVKSGVCAHVMLWKYKLCLRVSYKHTLKLCHRSSSFLLCAQITWKKWIKCMHICKYIIIWFFSVGCYFKNIFIWKYLNNSVHLKTIQNMETKIFCSSKYRGIEMKQNKIIDTHMMRERERLV